MLAQGVGGVQIVLVLVYLLVIGYLGWLGYRRTKTSADYLVAGRKAHPVIMALSYGATFISTSAIVGFGGVAAMFGMSLLWLTFLNIFVGIFIAFVLLGGPARRIGHRLDAHTFPELLGRRYQSKFIQFFAGSIIFLFIPIYAAAVIIGGTEFICQYFKIDYSVALLVFSVITAAYVISGGLKAVMYTDALQGTIMFVGMVVLLLWAYASVGGVVQGHQDLAAMKGDAFGGFKAIGQQGWSETPKFGWGWPEGVDPKKAPSPYDLWWIVFSTIVLGVGIGVLAQPQLVVRFMTVKSKRELNRAVGVGGVFILAMTGVAFTVGAISNVYFKKHEVVKGILIGESNEMVVAKQDRIPEHKRAVPCRLMHIDTNESGTADTHIVMSGVGPSAKGQVQKQWKDEKERTWVEVKPQSTAYTRAVVYDTASGQYLFNSDSIIPTYVTSAMPPWFGILFLLTLLAAAMSTMSSQFHAAGSSIGHDVFGTLTGRRQTIGVTRIGIVIGLVLAVLIGLKFRGDYFIARGTSIFFGLCASAFLPTFVGGLFFRRITKAGAIASMFVGLIVTAFWLLFVKSQEADAVGLIYQFMDHKTSSILNGVGNWPNVDSLVIALPLSVLTAILVSLFTRKPQEAHLDLCFRKEGPGGESPTTK